MLKKKILVRKVYNLTDARYFSAMNVDWMSFEVPAEDRKSWIKHFAEIMSWVEGPSFVLEIGGEQIDEQIEMMPNISGTVNNENLVLEKPEDFVQFVPVSLEDFLYAEKISTKDSSIQFILEVEKSLTELSSEEQEKLRKTGKHHTYFLDVSSENNADPDVLDFPGLSGLVFYGGAEEKTGIKSYELFDNWFDLLMESS